jgi:DNA-binding LytR/AlgR family response regulator
MALCLKQRRYKTIKMGNKLTVSTSLVNEYNDEVKELLDIELFSEPETSICKKSFLVFKHNKYFTVAIEKIAFFYVKYESSIISCFDGQEYFVHPSLDQIQTLLNGNQFFRLNRQYLINFNAIKEVEHYFARKLLVNLTIPVSDQLLITKEKSTGFLRWLDNR